MRLGDTIAAIASGRGPAPRGIVRLSGPHAHEAVRLLSASAAPSDASSLAPSALAPPAHARLELALPSLLPTLPPLHVPALCLRWRGPASYTGEDSAELHIVGQPPLLARVLQAVLGQPGVRGAEPGEFTARAFLNGRLSAEQAEGVQALIAAHTSAELHAAQRLLDGRAGAEYRDLALELSGLLALVEAGIDFAVQEDVVPISAQALSERLMSLRARIRAVLGPDRPSERAGWLPRVALAGAPNAGKSTLFNALLGRTRTLAGPVAGTTRDAIVERLDLRAWASPEVELVDAAGLTDAPGDPLNHAMQQVSRRELEQADVVIHCDPTGRFEPLPSLPEHDARTLRVRTKVDLFHVEHSPAQQLNAMPVCAIDGRNIDRLKQQLAHLVAARAGGPASSARSAHDAVHPRHRAALAACLNGLDSAHELSIQALHAHGLAGAELAAQHLRAALDALGSIVGHISPDEVIGLIFSTFCIGK